CGQRTRRRESRRRRELPSRLGCGGSGEVETRGDVGRRVKDDVLGGDAVGGVTGGAGRDGLGTSQALHATAPVDAYETGHVVHDLGALVHDGGRRPLPSRRSARRQAEQRADGKAQVL
uniref:Uncharacterized protein n=1 Tax=Triticum urartu TaxID=4572 RepID=A0A8R7TL35_TRIUA